MINPTFSGIITGLLLVMFIGIWIWAWSKNNKEAFDKMASLPLEDDHATSTKEKAE